MDANEKELFRKNFIWFNQFFSDLKQLLDAISNSLVSEFKLGIRNNHWYYPKLQYQPTLPSYYFIALGNEAFVAQIYAILDSELLKKQAAFKNEPCIIVVKHSRTDKVLWSDEYGLRIISNKQISQNQVNERVIAGEILTGESKGTKYFAFQVTLDHFAAGKDINATIQSEIIDVLRELPDWTGK